MMEFLIENTTDPNRISFLVSGVYKFRVPDCEGVLRGALPLLSGDTLVEDAATLLPRARRSCRPVRLPKGHQGANEVRFSFSKKVPLDEFSYRELRDLRRLDDDDLQKFIAEWSMRTALRMAGEYKQRRRENWVTGFRGWIAIAVSVSALVVSAIALYGPRRRAPDRPFLYCIGPARARHPDRRHGVAASTLWLGRA